MFLLFYFIPAVLAVIYAVADLKSFTVLKRSAFVLCAFFVTFPLLGYVIGTIQNTDPSIQFLMWVACVVYTATTALFAWALTRLVKLTKWLVQRKTKED